MFRAELDLVTPEVLQMFKVSDECQGHSITLQHCLTVKLLSFSWEIGVAESNIDFRSEAAK